MKIDGAKVAALRAKREMTQDALAEQVGVTRQAISLIEVGTVEEPLFGTVYQIAQALGVTVDDLVINGAAA